MNRRNSVCAAVILLGVSLAPLPARAQSNNATAYTFTTLAGTAGTGSADGIGNNAQFNLPEGVAVDGAGNIYVADTYNDTIRKITPPGVVSTLAGLAGAPGATDGAGSAARFSAPTDLVVDRAGNLYVTDGGNNTIRKITPGGIVSTFAGMAGIAGTNDGTGTGAQFNDPASLALDGATNLYVADYRNNTIRMITPGGVVSTLAGTPGIAGTNDGPGASAQFSFPAGIALDSATNLYVGDSGNSTIRMITPAGMVSTIAGSPGAEPGATDGPGTNALFSFPQGVVVDASGNLYVVDTGNNTIRMLSGGQTNWVVSTFAGNAAFFDPDNRLYAGYADGTGTNALFSHPFGITVDGQGNFYVADYGNDAIRKITSAAVVSTPAGLAVSYGSADGTGASARFKKPRGIAVDGADNIYVGDYGNGTVRKVTAEGVVGTLAGTAGVVGGNNGDGNEARFDLPQAVAADNLGNVYVTDTFNGQIRIVSPAGVVSALGFYDSFTGAHHVVFINDPQGIAVDTNDNLFVAASQPYISEFSTNGASVDVAGSVQSPCVAVDSSGNMYEANGNAIIKITPGGVVTSLAGVPGMSGASDGMGASAQFNSPQGIAVDSAGNVFVADTYNDTIREITPAGVVSTVAGVAGSQGSADGTGASALFYYPYGVAVDSAGNLYVADTGNNTIRKGVFSQFAQASPVPYIPPPANGQITVTLLPPEAGGQWRFPWELVWRDSGTTATNLVPGVYPLQFSGVPGYLAVPASGSVTIPPGGGIYSETNDYFPTVNSTDVNSGSGALTVNLGYSPPAGAGWNFVGAATPFLLPGYTTNLVAGTYLIDFAPVGGFATPPTLSVQITGGQTAVLQAPYQLAQTPPNGVQLPVPVPAASISDLTNYPYGFNGQLQTDVGYGSGVAVLTNVVLTAAHLIFNDQTLSYASEAWWFYQEEAGVFQPAPLSAQGWYVLSGYAAQRTNDLLGGLGADQSSPQSRDLDVAALYFDSPVANGGYGGYLPSDASPNTWLTGTADKMVVGYPVDGSQFGFTNIVPGEMYEDGPQPYPLSLAPDPVADQQVYTASWFLSYPGNSGGPFYVQLNGYYYPAGVYLGTLFNGIVPYASAVRAIDSNVVSLITLAAALGDSGTNNSGGGVITIIPSQLTSAKNPGYLVLQLGPAAAVQAGAAWKLAGQPVADYSSANPSLQEITSTNALVLQFKPVPGWNLPTNQSVAVTPGAILTNTAYYSVTNPVLTLDPVRGLGLSGTTNTSYQIQSNSALTGGGWVSFKTSTVVTNGFNLITNKPLPGFYRAAWLTNGP